MQTNQSRDYKFCSPHSLLGSHTLGPYSPVQIIPGPGIILLETDSMSQSMLKLLRVASPKSVEPALPCLSQGDYNETCYPHFPLTPYDF